jgi:predicted GNAT family N-acyltransferase
MTGSVRSPFVNVHNPADELHALNRLESQHLAQLLELYRHEWWTEKRTLPDVDGMLKGSDLVFACVTKTDELVGFARVLTDGVYKAFLFDVIVRPDYRGRELGGRLISDVIHHPVLSRVAMIELYCRPELERLYSSYGFSVDVGGIRLMRRTA